VASRNREVFHAFAAFSEAHSVAAAFGRGNRRIDEALALIDGPFFTQRIYQLFQSVAQHLTLTPRVKPAWTVL